MGGFPGQIVDFGSPTVGAAGVLTMAGGSGPVLFGTFGEFSRTSVGVSTTAGRAGGGDVVTLSKAVARKHSLTVTDIAMAVTIAIGNILTVGLIMVIVSVSVIVIVSVSVSARIVLGVRGGD